MPGFSEELIEELRASAWPPSREVEVRDLVARRRAFRKRDKAQLRVYAGWNDPGRPYLVDPLPKQIAKTYGDFLFGEAPTFRAAAEEEQEHVDEVLGENSYVAKLRRAARQVVSEGESWWRIHVNPAIADVPLVDWYSRLDVVPLFYGDRLLAVAFVTEVFREVVADDDDESQAAVWRHFEVHADGVVANVLFRGTDDTVGEERPLEDQAATEDLPPAWMHGQPMLAGRVINDADDDAYLGESDYDQVDDYFLALNEGLTISTENARLTGKDRVFVAGRLTQEDGGFNSGVEVFRQESEGGTLGDGDSRPPIVAVEKHYDSAALWFHIVKLTAVALARVGIVAQLVGEDTENSGSDSSGVAIRLRFLPTNNASEGKGAEWDAENPKIVHALLCVSALPMSTEEGVPGGFGKPYGGTPPSIERANPLPADDTEIVNRNALAVSASIRSLQVAIEDQHPDWTPDEVEDEIKRIREDAAAMAPDLLDLLDVPVDDPQDD